MFLAVFLTIGFKVALHGKAAVGANREGHGGLQREADSRRGLRKPQDEELRNGCIDQQECVGAAWHVEHTKGAEECGVVNPIQHPLNCRAWHCCASRWVIAICAGVMRREFLLFRCMQTLFRGFSVRSRPLGQRLSPTTVAPLRHPVAPPVLRYIVARG